MYNIGDLVIITSTIYPIIMLGLIEDSYGAIYDYNILFVKCSIPYDGIGKVWKFDKDSFSDITVTLAPRILQLLYSSL